MGTRATQTPLPPLLPRRWFCVLTRHHGRDKHGIWESRQISRDEAGLFCRWCGARWATLYA